MSTYQRLGELLAAIPHLPKDSEANAGSYKYRYISLGAILEAVQPIVLNHGFVLRGTTTPGAVAYELVDIDTGDVVNTAEVEIPRGVSDMQRLGSAITYARRYALTVLLDIAADDDDGQATRATRPPAVGETEAGTRRRREGPTNKQVVFNYVSQNKQQAQALWDEMTEAGMDPATLTTSDLLGWLVEHPDLQNHTQ